MALYFNYICFLAEYFSISTPGSSRSLSSPGKLEFRANFGPGLAYYFDIENSGEARDSP